MELILIVGPIDTLMGSVCSEKSPTYTLELGSV
jgi:hypothetical protein